MAGSKFIRLSGESLLLRLLENPYRGDSLASLVFKERAKEEGKDQFDIVQKLAMGVMKNPKRFGMYVNMAAAKFWEEHVGAKFSALAMPDGNIILS